MTRTILKSYEDSIISATIARVKSQIDTFYVVEYYTALKDVNYSSKLNYVTFSKDNCEQANKYFRELVTNAIA